MRRPEACKRVRLSQLQTTEPTHVALSTRYLLDALDRVHSLQGPQTQGWKSLPRNSSLSCVSRTQARAHDRTAIGHTHCHLGPGPGSFPRAAPDEDMAPPLPARATPPRAVAGAAPCHLTERLPSDPPRVHGHIPYVPHKCSFCQHKMKMESQRARIIFILGKHICKNVSIRLKASEHIYLDAAQTRSIRTYGASGIYL